MIVQIKETEAIPGGGKGVLLCDDNGDILPMQVSATVENGVGDLPKITVTFWIDGKDVRFA